MAGRGGDVVVTSRSQARGRKQRQTPSLPFDVLLEIAARSDPATLIRCATTCRDARRRIADGPSFRGRLRLRHTDRFVLPLLRGHLTGPEFCFGADIGEDAEDREDLYLVDTSAADATRLAKVTWGLSSDLQFPLGPSFDGSYVLLVGDGEGGAAVGRPFQVLKAKLVLSGYNRSARCLRIQTVSSEHGRTAGPLVVGDVVHWLCLTDAGSYVLMLHVGAARAT
uniref:F-box domain-containing protein n=1 Tax=Setaria italica TaxID=4555 RepID=K4A273_SETIT